MPETIGQRLKQLRLSRQITIEKAAEATRVRSTYLEALEADNYSAMSSAAQGRGFLRLYAGFLGLDLEAAMDELRQHQAVEATPEAPAAAPVTPPPAPLSALQTPPASSPDEKPVRRPFWSRLLRRGDFPSEAPEQSAAETAPVVTETPAPEPVTVSAEQPAPEEAPAPERPTLTPTKATRPKNDKPKTAAKKTDKKKVSPKSNLNE